MNITRSPKAIQQLTLIATISFSITLLLIAASSVGYVFAGNKAKGETESISREIKELNATLDRSKKLALRTPTAKAQAKFQAIIEETGAAYGCRLKEFQVANDPQPYLSKFELKTESKGWSQNTVQATLEGSNNAIFRVLDAIYRGPAPIEFDALELNAAGAKAGEVSAKLTFRILSMEVKK